MESMDKYCIVYAQSFLLPELLVDDLAISSLPTYSYGFRTLRSRQSQVGTVTCNKAS